MCCTECTKTNWKTFEETLSRGRNRSIKVWHVTDDDDYGEGDDDDDDDGDDDDDDDDDDVLSGRCFS